jgi:hypothetical protein
MSRNTLPRGVSEAQCMLGSIARLQRSDPCPTQPHYDPDAARTVDSDADGLNAFEELRLLTSDHHVDTDEDGRPDAEDMSPNGAALTYRDTVYSLLQHPLRLHCRLGHSSCLLRRAARHQC